MKTLFTLYENKFQILLLDFDNTCNVKLSRVYMKQKSHWSLTLSFRLAVSVKWRSLQKKEMSKMVGVWLNCKWRQPQSAHIWKILFLSFTCITGTYTSLWAISLAIEQYISQLPKDIIIFHSMDNIGQSGELVEVDWFYVQFVHSL